MTSCQFLKSSGLNIFYVEVWGSKRLQDYVIFLPIYTESYLATIKYKH